MVETDVLTACVGVISRTNVIMVIQLVFIAQCRVCGWLIGPGWCSPEIDCCWLRLTFRQPVWESFSESMLLWSCSWYLQHSTVSCLWLVDRPGWCNPEKDCCWLRLTFRQPVWESSLESMLLWPYSWYLQHSVVFVVG